MINNNLDYEKNCNTTTTASIRTTTTRFSPTNMLDLSKSSLTIANNMNNMIATNNPTTPTLTATPPPTITTTTNDNNYFNRFDNRIAANLAAVINGARFRSSSCSKTSSKAYKNSHINCNDKTIIGGNANRNTNSNSIRLNANNIVSSSITNLHFNNSNIGCGGNGGCFDGVGVGVGVGNRNVLERQYQGNYHFDGIKTFGDAVGATRQQLPSKHHLQLNVANADGCYRSRPNSPYFQYNRHDESKTTRTTAKKLPTTTASIGRQRQRQRPSYLFSQANLNCNDNEKVAQSPSSDEDNSPTELNNCKRLADKPPLVKRLTMGLLRSHEESRPLVNAAGTPTSAIANGQHTRCSSPKANDFSLSAKQAVYSYGYINEEAFEPEKFIASKFGDSCRQSLTAIPMLDTINLNDNSEFNLKKRYLRETSSANSSPKIFGNRLRGNAATTTLYNSTVAGYAQRNNVNSSLATSVDDDEAELKDACWFQAGISREIAAEVLSSKSPGAFLVRKSSSKSGCYALTLRIPSPPGPKIANYIILRTSRGYKINGFRKEFSSLKALITHHSVMPELLPIPLAMPRPTNMTSSRRNLDDFDTYDSLQMLLKYLRAKNLENSE